MELKRRLLDVVVPESLATSIFEQCVERVKSWPITEEQQSELLDGLRVEIDRDRKYYKGDIHVFAEDGLGVSWTFDKNTGFLHST